MHYVLYFGLSIQSSIVNMIFLFVYFCVLYNKKVKNPFNYYDLRLFLCLSFKIEYNFIFTCCYNHLKKPANFINLKNMFLFFLVKSCKHLLAVVPIVNISIFIPT